MASFTRPHLAPPAQNGIADNLPELQRNGLHWSEVAVVVLVDGRDRASATLLEYASNTLQVYDQSLLRFYKADAPVTMHFFGSSRSGRRREGRPPQPLRPQRRP